MKNKSEDKISFLIHYSRTKPIRSKVFETYWQFATERQNIFFRRFSGEPYPWTTDEILTSNKFTNVYRATDRVSQYLIKNVIYQGDQNIVEVFFRTMLFKIFNRISTWEILKNNLQEISFEKYSFEKYNNILLSILDSKSPIYSPAYIMASGRSAFGYLKKHQNHLRLIELMIKEGVPAKLQDCSGMKQAYNILLSYPSIGEFLAYQYVTDINYSNITHFGEMEFVKAGPGAKDGIRKCFKSFGEYSFEDIIQMTADNQEKELSLLGLDFKDLWGRPMQFIDCQNVFCEVDKYSRVAHPDVSGYSNRVRIKQKFKFEEKEVIDFYFPPKWKIF